VVHGGEGIVDGETRLLRSGEWVQNALHDELLSARNAAYIERLDGLLFNRQVALADDDPC
jgi:hypothetical protein